ncbi:MAG: Asp/Glu/hydantoin racemase [Planctomycetes bacterium]|nr:Asp/Glu/hydantoin racemase [Planctomycetota bacterium]
MRRRCRGSSFAVRRLAIGVVAIAVLLPPAWGEPHSRVRRDVQRTARSVYGQPIPPDYFRSFPIGVFDSGTGGLTVLEQILRIDTFDNRTGKLRPGGDGIPDFQQESFVFLADQANMPYGNYPVVGKADFLDDLILRDLQFLLGRRYFDTAEASEPRGDKLPVKAVVIACNTATAYGLTDIQQTLERAGVALPVVGVIDAAAEGAVEVFADQIPGAVGVLATKGTVLSGAYPAAIRKAARQAGRDRLISVVQQGALGLAGAIDGAPEYIARGRKDRRPRDEYRGPSPENPQARIALRLLDRYGFDFSGMLYSGSPERPTDLQLNSVDNYIAYHMVSLMEKVRQVRPRRPLRVIVLGCTHFPFFADAFRRQLHRLYDYQEEGQFVYRPCMASDIHLIDPAYFVGREVYERLADSGSLRRQQQSTAGKPHSEFYITVPCRKRPDVRLDPSGWFTYEYKYGRSSGQTQLDYRHVLLRRTLLPAEDQRRLQRRAPTVWRLLERFWSGSAKLQRPAAAPH